MCSVCNMYNSLPGKSLCHKQACTQPVQLCTNLVRVVSASDAVRMDFFQRGSQPGSKTPGFAAPRGFRARHGAPLRDLARFDASCNHMVGTNYPQSATSHQQETHTKGRDVHKRLLTLNEAGAYIGLSHWRVRSPIYSGQLAYVRLGRRILIDLKDLDALIDSKKQRECVRQHGREV
jgi:excisionase family DNA binding protein